MSHHSGESRWSRLRPIALLGALAAVAATGCLGDPSTDGSGVTDTAADHADGGPAALVGWDLIGRWEGVGKQTMREVNGVAVVDEDLGELPVSFEIAEACGRGAELVVMDDLPRPDPIPADWCVLTVSFQDRPPVHLRTDGERWTWAMTEQFSCDVSEDEQTTVVTGELWVPDDSGERGMDERPDALVARYHDDVRFPSGCSYWGHRSIVADARADLRFVDFGRT